MYYICRAIGIVTIGAIRISLLSCGNIFAVGIEEDNSHFGFLREDVHHAWVHGIVLKHYMIM